MDEEELDKPKTGLARDTARRLLKEANITSFPVKLKDIARNIEDIVIQGEELVEEISGMQGTYKGVSFIRYNTSHSIKRNRFTVAHELAHAILGHANMSCGISYFKTRNPQEVEANQFAAELLMPLEILKKAIEKNKTVKELAEAFWVSEESMSVRVMETGQYKKISSWK